MSGMAEETITFELIRKIQREEEASPKLSKLPENFYENVKKYLQQKRKILEKMEDRKASVEIKNIERLVEDIFNRRERKIVTQAINSARVNLTVENLTEEEKEFFQKIERMIKERREKFLKELMEKGEKEKVSMVVFKEAVPEFLGADLKTYGPFEKGDIARLPEENVKILVERGLAEEFKVNKD
jgi:DNA replication initiation complex subunit (GINS family)